MSKKIVKKESNSKPVSPKTSTASKTATATKTSTSTDAYTQGNITVTGGAGKGSTTVKIGLPGGSLANNAKKATKATKAKNKK
jgi:hypothetical protein